MYRLVILAFIVGVYGQDNSFSCQEKIKILKDDSYWYGYGVVKYKKIRKNKSLEQAKEIALGDLASKINTKIESFASISSSQIIKNDKSEFIQSSSSKTFTSTSAEINDYTIEFSGSCSKKQYLVVVKLNKQDFFDQQEVLMKKYLSESYRAISSDSLFKNKLSYIDQTYISLRDIGRLVGVDSGLLEDYYSQVSLLAEEYERLIRDITIDFNLSSPLMYHTDKPVQLILNIYDKKTKQSISPVSVEIKSQNNNEEKILKTNSEGVIKINLLSNIKEITPINFNATVDIASELKDHTLFKKYKSSNPNYDYVLNTIPLTVKQEINTDNKYLQKKLKPITLSLHKLIQNNMKVSFDSNTPAYTLELKCDSVSQYIASNGQYVIKFLPTLYLINQATNVVEFQFNFPEQKGLSWIEYDKSFKYINKSMNQYIEEVSDGIIQVFM